MDQANNSTLGFFSRIRENYSNKFLQLTITTSFSEKDGNSDDDTLIHNAFVKYFDEKNQPYPEWLGVKQGGATNDPNVYLEFQPVRQAYSLNSQGNFTPRNLWTRDPPTQAGGYQPVARGGQPQLVGESTPPDRSGYSRSLRLDNLYNKQRQQQGVGSGYNSSQPQVQRTNTGGYSATGLRLRERMLNANRSPR